MRRFLLATCLLATVFSAPAAHARYYGGQGDITYKTPSVSIGNRDVVQTNESSYVGAYRLMNGLTMPSKLANKNYYYNYSDSKKWSEALANIGIKTNDEGYGYDCNYKYAETLLNDRIRLLGITHPYVREWAEAQAAVLGDCRSHSASFNPKPITLQQDDSPALKQMKVTDRAYQLASSRFYGENYREAITLYTAIGADMKSPYRALAHYMIARSLLHQGNEKEAYDKLQAIQKDSSLASIHEDARDLVGTLAANSDGDTYRAEQLENYLKQLTKLLTTEADAQSFAASFETDNWNLWYFLNIYGTTAPLITEEAKHNDLLDWALTFTVPSYEVGRNWNAGTPRDTCRNTGNGCLTAEHITDHSYHQWQVTGKTHWFLVLMMHLPQGDHRIAEALRNFDAIHQRIDAGTASVAEQYAWPTLVFEATRLLAYESKDDAVEALVYPALEFQKEYAPRTAFHVAQYWLATGNYARAGKLLDTVVKQDGFLEATDFYRLKLLLAKTPREIVALDQKMNRNQQSFYGWNESGHDTHFAAPVADMLNLMPLHVLAELCEDPLLKNDRERYAELVRVTWIRAALLGNSALVNQLYPGFLNQSSSAQQMQLRAYQSATTPEDKQRALTYLLLKNPRFKPYISVGYASEQENDQEIDKANPNDNNWWCAYDTRARSDQFATHLYDAALYNGEAGWGAQIKETAELKRVKDAYFADQPLLKLIDLQELDALTALGSATSYLPKNAVGWANDTTIFRRYIAADNRIPEALHLSVKVTRYGCRIDPDRSAHSKEAFTTLHKQYPYNRWTIKTPYRF